jgi:GNAT superfamily N-acetyltransferase
MILETGKVNIVDSEHEKIGSVKWAIVKQNMAEYVCNHGQTQCAEISKVNGINEFIYLYKLKVPKEHRRKGIGTEILTAVAERYNLPLLLILYPDKPKLRLFYAKNGFEQIDDTWFYLKRQGNSEAALKAEKGASQ